MRPLLASERGTNRDCLFAAFGCLTDYGSGSLVLHFIPMQALTYTLLTTQRYSVARGAYREWFLLAVHPSMPSTANQTTELRRRAQTGRSGSYDPARAKGTISHTLSHPALLLFYSLTLSFLLLTRALVFRKREVAEYVVCSM